MTPRTLGRFLIGVVAAAAALHVFTVLLVTTGLYSLYPHRMFDVRRWSDNAAEGFQLVGTYLNATARTAGRPVTVFAGSSVTYGHMWHERVTFAHLFAEARPATKVINASIIAADVSAINDWIVCAAKRNQLHFDTLVIELPVVNALSYLVNTHHAGHPPSPLRTCDTPAGDPGYFQLALSTFRGIGWIPFFWGSQAYLAGERQIRIERVPKGYFATATDFDAVRAAFATQIASTLSAAQSAARIVYAFPSPVFAAGLEDVDEDGAAMRRQLQAALDACRAVPGVRCIDPAGLYAERSYYLNLTHFNQAGHRAMADLLNAQIAQ